MTKLSPPSYRRMSAVYPVSVADKEVQASFCELIGIHDVPSPGSVTVDMGESPIGLDSHSSSWYIPRFLRYFDQARIVRVCICPRPVMVLAPTEDEDMPASGVNEMESEVRLAYSSAGCTHRFEVHRLHLNHLFLSEHLYSVVAFFKRCL